MTMNEVLNKLRIGRSEWEAMLARVDATRMTEPGVLGDWSVKDVIAHVTWGEREMVPLFRDRELVGSPLWRLTTDARNAAMVEESRSKSLAQVLAEARDVWPELLAALEGITDAELNDPAHFKDMPADWVPWQILAGNTYDHYLEHLEPIRNWLEGSGNRSSSRI